MKLFLLGFVFGVACRSLLNGERAIAAGVREYFEREVLA